jgi:hypothetical protein
MLPFLADPNTGEGGGRCTHLSSVADPDPEGS